MTKKLSKKLISIVLSILMVLSLIPTGMITAFASLDDGKCEICKHTESSHTQASGAAIGNSASVIGACSECGGTPACSGLAWMQAVEGTNGPLNYPEVHHCSKMTATHYTIDSIPSTGKSLKCKQYTYDDNTGKWKVGSTLKSMSKTSFDNDIAVGNGKIYIASPSNDGTYIECVEDSTPEWVDTIVSKVDAVAEDLYSEAWGATLKEYLANTDFDSLDSLVSDMEAPEYSQEGSVYTIEGETTYGNYIVAITLDEDENIASVAINYAGAYTVTFTPAPTGPDTSSWPTSYVHDGCQHSGVEHFYATGVIYGNDNGNVEGRLFYDSTSYDNMYDGSPMATAVSSFETNGADIEGWYYWDGGFYPCSAPAGPTYVEQILAFIEGKNCMQLLDVTDGYSCIAKGYDDTVDAIEAMADSITSVSNGGKFFSTAESEFALDEVHTNHFYDGASVCEYCAFDPNSACGKCATCGHSNRYYNGSYCTKCKAEEGPCKNAGSPFASCVQTVGHTGSHSAHTHTFATEWSSDTTQHWHAATCEHTTEKDSLANHSGGTATCTTQAVCSTCGASYGELASHSFNTTASTTKATDATCTAAATYYVKCDNCTAVDTVKTVPVGNPAPHSFTTKASNQLVASASCLAASTYKVQCDNCTAVSDTKTVSVGNPLGHTYATTWSSDENQHWYAATCEHNTLKKDTANHTYGTTGDARFTCTVCSAVNEAKKLQAAKADAKAAIDAYVADSESEDAHMIAEHAKQEIDSAETVEDVNDIKAKALEDIKDIIAPDFATLAKDLKYDGTEVKLTKDYTRAPSQQGISILNGQKVVIDLNGHTLDGAKDDNIIGDFIFFVNEGAELVINDSTDNEGVITGGTGYFSVNNSRTYGGAIYNDGTLTINGGTFTGNTVDNGGAIHNGGTLTINGGAFTNNIAYGQGGAINNVGKDTVLTITGGTFTGNKSGYGGAIENYYGSVATITGGTFTDNTAKNNGGAIDNDGSTLYIGGSVVIKDNVLDENLGTENEGNGIANNVEVYGATIVLDEETALTEDAEIGVTLSAETDTIIAEGATLDTLKALKSDDATKMFIVDNGAVKIMNIADHTHAGGSATCQVLAICQSCGASYGTYAQHSYTDYVSDENATCTEDGTKTAACDYECGATSTITDEGTATGHHYTSKVTKKATYSATGVRTYTCTCGDSYNEKIARLPITSAVRYNNSTKLDSAFAVSSSTKDVTVKWGKVADADGYMVYAAYCGKDNKAKLIKTIKGADTRTYTFTKLDGKNIDLTKNMKAYVVAYKVVDGQKVEFGKTIVGHVVGGKSLKYTNSTKVTVAKDTVALNVGKTSTIKATVTYKNPNKKHISDSHAAEKRYRSSNKAVATVDANGKITAVGKGTCVIRVFAKNGTSAKVTVTVK